MRTEIPKTIGLLLLAAVAAGCSPAAAIADAFEKVCKAECECSDSHDLWDEEKNCKNSCEGQAKALQAQLADNENEPCEDVRDIAKDLKDCHKEGCGEDRDECVTQAYADLYECWPGDDGGQGDGLDEAASRMLFGANFPEDAVEVAD